MKEFIGHIFFRSFVFPFRFIPFWLLYFIADVLSFVFYKIFAYRKKIVWTNLKNSFPEKTDKELEQIAKKYYRNLADISLEWFKGFSMSKQQMLKRYKVLNLELFDDFLSQGRSILGVSSHYCNWEWGTLAFCLQFQYPTIALYKPLNNKYTDKYIRKKRTAWGMQLVPIQVTARVFAKNKDIPSIYIMISDQSPSNIEKAIWVKFLNQDTPCLHGPELYAQRMDYPVIYGDVQRVKRGYYEITLSIIEAQPLEAKPNEITQKIMEKLESIIIKKPENWLWSHKRWKHKRTI